MMTLEEAIKAEEAEILSYEECLNSLDDNMPTDMWNELNKSLGKQMDYHRQLAEWLRELKAYRKAEKEIEQELVNWNDIDNGKCRGLFLATSIIQHYKNGEVNADD